MIQIADNTTIDAGSGGDVIATDDIGGVKYQRVKISQGADGSATDVGIGGGTEATALRVTIASDSTGVLSVDDNGSTLSVDGTVTANLGATDTAALAAVETAVELLDDTVYTDGTGTPSKAIGVAGSDGTNPQIISTNTSGHVNIADGGNAITVDGTVAVTGVATAANQTTLIGHVDGVEGLLTTIDGRVDGIEGLLTTIDADTSNLSVTGGGTETGALRVTVASNSTGVLSVDDNGSTLSVDDGGSSITVDGTVAVSGTVAVTDNSGSLTVDNAGTFAVQADTELTTADLDTGGGTDTRAVVGIALAASGGAVLAGTANPVPISDNSGSLTVDNGGTFAVQDSQVVTDNAGFTDGTTKVFMGGFIYDETAGTALTENDAAAARVNVNRAQVGIIEDGSTRGRYATVSASNALKVDGSAVTQPVSYGTTGSGNATGALRVELANNGTGLLSTVSTVTTVSTLTGGGVAHDGADSGNPVKVGGKAGTADITAVADGDRTDMRFDSLGHQIVRPYALHENLVNGSTSAITDTTSTSVIAAAGSGVRNYITALTVTNSHASVGTLVSIKDGSGGSTLWQGYCAAVGGGFTISFPTPLRGSANTAVHAVCGTTGSNVYVSAAGYKSAV